MTGSTGISAATAQPLSGWPHVEQSIRKILMTPIGARVMLREFGSELPELVDRKMTTGNVLAIYSASARAIHRWEPRFRMQFGRITDAEVSGRVGIELFGTYYPKGHKGDYSVAESASTRIVYERAT